jgi:hypothetical protein
MVDRYTKVVLTIIAIALTVIAAKGALRQSLAQAGSPDHPIKVQICDARFRCAEIVDASTPRRIGEYGLRVVGEQ